MQRKRELIALALLGVALVAVLVYQLTLAGAPAGVPSAVAPGPAAGGKRAQAPVSAVPAVHLDALTAATTTTPEPTTAGRNLFQFQPKVAPPPPVPTGARAGGPGTAGTGAAVVPTTPPPLPPPPPIPLKFIGIVQSPEKKLAVLQDAATRDVFYGREGEIIDGRYRILRIAVESIDMAYVDGRGRQTIRLTGS